MGYKTPHNAVEYGLVYNLTLLQLADDKTLHFLGVKKDERDTLMDTTWRLHSSHEDVPEIAYSAKRPENNYWWYYPSHMPRNRASYLLNFSLRSDASLKKLSKWSLMAEDTAELTIASGTKSWNRSHPRLAENRYDITMDCHDYQNKVHHLVTPPTISSDYPELVRGLLDLALNENAELRGDLSPKEQDRNRIATGVPFLTEVRLLRSNRLVETLDAQRKTGELRYLGNEMVRAIEANTDEHFASGRRFDILTYNC